MFTKLLFKHKQNKGFVSIIIPVYNDYIGLKDTLHSLTKQTLSLKNYEVIVINDGGNKKISQVIEKYNHKEIKVMPNKGSYFARNRGLELSKGEYVAFTDADVIVQPNWLEKGLLCLQKFDYIGGRIQIDKSKVKTIPTLYDYFNAFQVSQYLIGEHFAPTANLFVKKKVFETIGGFDEALQSGGDLEFGNRVFTSKKYKQFYDETIQVIHPPRTYTEIIKKIIRITKGHKDLIHSYPNRFKYRDWPKLAIIRASMTFPKFFYEDQTFLTNIQIFILSCWIKVFETYIRVSKSK